MRQFRDAPALLLAVVVAITSACGRSTQSGRAVRIFSGKSDTIIINHVAVTLLPVSALDAQDRPVENEPIQFERISGSDIALTSAGQVKCASSGDATVRATLAEMSTTLFIRCRPVEHLQITGPIQFVLGDSALSGQAALPITALDNRMRAVDMIAGRLSVLDSSIAAVGSTWVQPRTRGTTLVSARIGNHTATTGVHVYQRLDTQNALDTLHRVNNRKRQFALPILLQPRDELRVRLPTGDWMITTLMRTKADSVPTKLRFENVSCTANILNDPNRYGCHPGSDAYVIVSRATSANATPLVSGYLLLRWLAE